MISKETKTAIIAEYKINEKDTGSRYRSLSLPIESTASPTT